MAYLPDCEVWNNGVLIIFLFRPWPWWRGRKEENGRDVKEGTRWRERERKKGGSERGKRRVHPCISVRQMTYSPQCHLSCLPLLFLLFLPLFFSFLWYWGLNSGLHLESLHQPFFVNGLFKSGSHSTVCPGWL
jgi:hypothetical protein